MVSPPYFKRLIHGIRQRLNELFILRLLIVSKMYKHPVKHLVKKRFRFCFFGHVFIDSNNASLVVYLSEMCIRIKAVFALHDCVRYSAYL